MAEKDTKNTCDCGCTEEEKKDQVCDCGCDENEEEDYITLEFDDGEEVECMVIGVFTAAKKDYIALAPDDESGDVYIYKYIENNDGTYDIEDIEDEDEFNTAVAEFDKIIEEEA